MEIDLKRTTGGYMSVDADAAYEKNREVIEKIRALWEQKTSATRKPLEPRADDKK
jgi:hypothetical protein